MKKNKSMWIALGCLAAVLVLFLIVKLVNANADKKAEEQKEAETSYITDLGDIAEISYTIDGETVTFEKQDGDWVMKDEESFPLDQSVPEEIASKWQHLPSVRMLEDGDDVSSYGLDDPVYEITLTDENGDTVHLGVGNSNTEGYYVIDEDNDWIYTMESSYWEMMTTDKSDLAVLDDYPSISSGNLEKVTITVDGNTTTYDGENDDDALAIATCAGGLGALTLTTVADYTVKDSDLKTYGLNEDARTTVEVEYTNNDEPEEMTLYIGAEDGDGNRYVTINDSKIIYLVGDTICSNVLNESSDDTESTDSTATTEN